MPRLLGPEDGCRQATVAGRTFDRQRDGTFHMDAASAKAAVATGDFTEARTSLSGVAGYRCGDCGFLAVFPRNCGRCGGDNLVRE